MTIYGISQSSGVERRLQVEMGSQGVVLIITDHPEDRERDRIMVPADDLLAAITNPPAGGTRLEGISLPQAGKGQLELEVRRNEVLLRAHTDTGEGADVAVGLDDLQDALEGIITH
jgi:hypothetical protein